MKPKVKTWLNQIESGMISSNTTRILNYIMNNEGCTILHMREDLLCSHQTMTAIISSLMDEGLVKMDGEIEQDNSHYSKLYFVNDIDERKSLVSDRHEERFKKFINSMHDYLDRLDDIQEHLDTLRAELVYELTHEPNDTTGSQRIHPNGVQGSLF